MFFDRYIVRNVRRIRESTISRFQRLWTLRISLLSISSIPKYVNFRGARTFRENVTSWKFSAILAYVRMRADEMQMRVESDGKRNEAHRSYFARRKSQWISSLLLFDAFSLTSSSVTINYRAGGRGGSGTGSRKSWIYICRQSRPRSRNKFAGKRGRERRESYTDEGSMPIRESEENYFYRCSNVRGIFGGN